MKTIRVVVIILLSFLWREGVAQIKSQIDERHELSGVVWRLAGAEEYVNNNVIDSYASDIEKYFDKYKAHPLLDFIRQLREEPYVIGYNGPVGIARRLKIQNNRVILTQGCDLKTFVSTSDPRWTEKAAEQYIVLLNDFYRKSNFRRFFNDHLQLYRQAEASMDNLLKEVNTQWFESFFGQPFGQPKVYLSLSYGFNNYSLPAWTMGQQNKNDYGVVLGCTLSDEKGAPFYSNNYLRTIVHEFFHNFSNPIVDRFYSQLDRAAVEIFPYVKDSLQKVGYGDAKSMMYEGLNELFCNIYLEKISKGSARFNIGRNETHGFVWMGRGIRFMENFLKDTIRYPSIVEFMPEMVGFMDRIADNMSTVMREFSTRNPYVVNIYPARKTGVSTDIKEIRIEFSKPMLGVTSFAKLLRENIIPLEDSRYYWADERTYVIEIKGPLKSNTTYGTKLIGDYFYSKEYAHPMDHDVEIIFKTAE